MGNLNDSIIYDCGSKYIGQVINNLPQGKGILYINKKSSLFNPNIAVDKENFNVIEGEFENGTIKNVNIKLKNGFKYTGELPNQKQIQIGKLIDSQNVEYQGKFQKGRLTQGKITSLQNKDQHQISYICETQGQYIGTSIINGQSTFYNMSDKYIASGEFYKGKLIKGIYVFQNGDKYDGQLSQGVMNGKGKYKTAKMKTLNDKKNDQVEKEIKYENQLLKSGKDQNELPFSYEGSFQSNQPNGKGTLTFANGHSYKGKFKHGKFHGQGQYSFPDGTIYKGSFYCGQMNGECKIQFSPKSKINLNKAKHQILQKYQGQVDNGIFHGLGILYYQNGVIFKGYFLNGAKNGPGVLIYCQNKFKCLYVMNKLVGQLKPILDQ